MSLEITPPRSFLRREPIIELLVWTLNNPFSYRFRLSFTLSKHNINFMSLVYVHLNLGLCIRDRHT